ARTYDPQGNPVGGEYQVNATPLAGFYPKIAYRPGGDFLEVYPVSTGNQTEAILGRWSQLPPPVSVPGPQAIRSDSVLTFSAANGNAITVADVAAASTDVETLYIQDLWGTLHVANTSGLGSISGNDTSL